MADALPATRSGVTFELERLQVTDGRVEVQGRWAGAEGLRFLRPTLLVDGRAVLAALDDKPWAPDADEWRAAFPWDDETLGGRRVALEVAPSVAVQLRPAGARAATPSPPAPTRFERFARPADAGRAAREALPDGVAPEEDAARTDAERRRASRAARRAAAADGDGAAAEGDGADPLPPDRALEDERRAREAAERTRDAALARADEAVRDREAAVRSLERAERRRAEADAARAEAEAAHLEVRAQRDEAVLAVEALRRQLDVARAQGLRDVAEAPPGDLAAAPEPAAGPADPDEPLGVRAVPSVGPVAGDLARAARSEPVRATQADLWLIRVFGAITATCFLALLVMLLRLFL